MDSEKEKNAQVKAENPPMPVIKSKSAERLIDEIKSHKNKNRKHESSYRVGNYLIKNTLGSGTFGKVKLGIYIPTQEKVAVKILEKSKMTEKDDQVRLEREFEMLAQFNHPNLIMVTEIFESDNNYYTVMDYCEGGELFNYIVKKKYLSEKEASFFYYQIISGLEYIHSLGIVHRDLKPENLLLTKDHILKIIDFGLSNYFKEGQDDLLYTPCGSPCYASPEMVTGNNYDGVMIDIWSTGIILFAMLCGYLPFEDKNNEKLFKKIAECKIDYPEFLSENALDLLKKIIVPNPKKRITINEIKKHPFYIKGKNLFDQEFTIQYLSDEAVNSEKNENSNKNNINMQNKDNNNKENYSEKNNNENKKIDKKEEKLEKKDENKPIKNEVNNENKENCNNNYNINIDNEIKNSLSDNKNGDNSTNYIKKKNFSKNNMVSNKSLKIGINNSIKNNETNNIRKNYDNNNNIKYKNKDTIKEKDNQDKKNSNKTTSNDLNIFINKTQNELNDEKEKINTTINNNSNNKELHHKANNNVNINNSSINNNEKNIINSFNLKTLDDIKNNIAITEVTTTINNTEANINLENIDINNKKGNKLSDKNYLRIDELNNLNNSVDNKKVRNNNVNAYSNNIFNKSKEIKKKVNEINNNNYCSNTYNIKKNKNILKGNKVVSTVLGKILKINISEKSKIKENIKNKEIKFKKLNPNKKNEDELNKKIFNKRNTYCEGDSKVFDKQKLKAKAKEKKTEANNSKKNKIFNPKTKYFILNSLSTDIKNNNIQFDIDNKKNIVQNIGNFYIHENSGGNNSVRQDFYPTAMKKIGGVRKNYIENLKITSNSINKNKNLSINNKSNNDFHEYNIKTEANEVLHTEVGVNNMDQNSKHKFKMNKNLFKIESKLSSKESTNKQKNSLYKKQNKGIYSTNNLKYFKVSNNGLILKNVCKNILNEDRLTSNRKRNFKRKFNNLSNSNNIHHSENKIKKFSKIFIQKNVDNITSLANITSSYSSKINKNFNFNSDFVNYNININNSKEKKSSSSKNKSLKNVKILNFSNKYPIYYIEDGLSTIDYETKNKNINIVHSIKNKNNPAFSKYVRQIRKNNNYIHIRKKQIKSGNANRNKNRSITKTKTNQKSISTEENINLKENINSNMNSIKNPFNKINNTSLTNNKTQVSRHKINLKKNNIYELSNNYETNPLLNISNTFISFNMYPKYYLDPKKKLSSPKIIGESPQHLKFSKKNISNIKINANKKLASLVTNNHIRKNTSPGLVSPSKKYEINNFTKIQQNIINNIDNQKLFYYTNTEYDQNVSFPKNINLDTIRNSKNKLLSKKYKAICREITSNNNIKKWKENINQNINLNNKNLSNTISPTNNKKYKNINFNNIFNKHNLEYNKISTINMNNINNNNKNNEKKNNYLSNYVLNYGNNNSNKKNKNKELEIISPTHDIHFMKKNDILKAFEKFNYNTITNKDLSSKYGITLKLNKKNIK